MSKPSQPNAKPIFWADIARVSFGILAIIACCFLILDSARSGFSRFLSMLAIIQSSVEAADHAVSTSPKDPEAHYTRALSLLNAERLEEARGELVETTRLRPYHYNEWLDLGITLDRVGDYSGAEQALRRSISLAPAFAQPHWQLGNLLYRGGHFAEAFEELRHGARGNPNLTDGMARLAWLAANGDVGTFLSLVQPENKRAHLVVGHFMSNQGKGAEAAEQIREAGEPTNDQERNLIRETISHLISIREFSAAFEIWTLSHDNAAKARDGIDNGDFLNPILRNDPGFGWELPPIPTVAAAIDTSGPVPGTRSLRVEFSGESPATTRLVNQLVLVQPGRRYTLRFVAKAEKLLTGGPPVMTVLSISTPERMLGQSVPLAVGTSDWTPYQVDFWADPDAPVVTVSLQRQQCSQTPCPIFGRLWLSQVFLTKS
jgi:hypothetical protein